MNTIVGTSNPASSRYASSSAASILARERRVVSKRTLPVLMYVATSVKPAASVARTMASLGNFRVGPRLIARRNPTYVAMRRSCPTQPPGLREQWLATERRSNPAMARSLPYGSTPELTVGDSPSG